jgi:hypothetical protein
LAANLKDINKSNQKLVEGLNKVNTKLNSLSGKSFDGISRSADKASRSIGRAAKSMSGLQDITRGSVGSRALAVGGLGGTAVIVDTLKKIGNAASSLNPFNRGVEAAAVKTGFFSSKLSALAGLITAHPLLAGTAAVAYTLFGDKLQDVVVKGIPPLIKGLGGLKNAVKDGGNDVLFAVTGYKKLETQFNLTAAAAAKLNSAIRSPRGLITPRNRAFGLREGGTPIEEDVRRKNRRINEMAARHREARLVTTVKAGSESRRMGRDIKRLKTIDENMKRTAIESKRSNALLAAQAFAGPAALPPGIGTQYGAPIGPVAPTRLQRAGAFANRVGFGKNANPQGMFASGRGMQGRIGGAVSSGLIGGGFPLLFGQSGLASALGGLGGLAGGALGGGFGFGLSIAGTAIAGRIQEAIDFRKSIKDLNEEMKSMGFNSGYNAKEIIKLGKSLGITKQEAIQVAEQFKRFGKQGALFAQAFGGDYGAFTAVAQATEVESAMAAIKAINKDLSLEEELRYTLALRTLGVEKTIDQILQKQLEKQRQKVREKFDISDAKQPLRPGFRNRRTEALNEEDERIQKTIDGLQRVRDAYKEVQLAAEANSRSIVTGLENVNRELRKLNDPQFQIVEGARAISEAFSTSFKGIISGTMSVQQAFANMFQRIADHFLDMAAQMAATQLQKGILSMFANSFTAGLGSSALSGATLPTDVGGLSFKDAMNMGTSYFASGGYVTKPTVGLVGEAGEDEYVIPASKMASSMQRYSAGARGEAVIPGTGSSYAGGGAGGSTTVNYSGPILNFNSEEFVPKSAVGQIIATATSQGAKAGENRTLTTLRNSRSTRSRLGM